MSFMAKKVDINGFWLIKDNPVTKEGVFPYSGQQIDHDGSMGLESNKIYFVYRPESELARAETVESFNGVPFIDNHEMIGEGCTEYDARPAGGVMFNVKPPKSGLMSADFKIFSESLKDEIEGGKKELSLGYRCQYERRMGVFAGKTYDFVQRNIVGNHIALVTKGRMGSEVRVYDSKSVVYDSIEEIKPMKTLKERLLAVMDESFSEDEKALISKAMDVEPAVTPAEKEEDGAPLGNENAKGPHKEASSKEMSAKDECASEEKKDDEKAETKDESEKKPDEKKDDSEKGEEKKAVSMDEILPEVMKMIASRDALVEQVKPLIGAFDHAVMTEDQVAVYSCDKLKLHAEKGEHKAMLKGYLAGKSGKVSVAMDQAAPKSGKDAALEKYLNKQGVK
jgi:hypothetical protein